MTTIDLFEALRTQRSVRNFTDRPVSDEDVDRILEAASWAPNAANRQLWEFIVVRDPGLKLGIAELYRKSISLLRESMPLTRPAPDARSGHQAVIKWAGHLEENLETVPVIILVGYDRAQMPYSRDGIFKAFRDETVYTGVMPAVQNLMLAARGLGLGTCLTTVANIWSGKIKELLGIPEHIQLVALLPLGYPAPPFDSFPPVRRIPVAEKVHRDGW